jgi:hypothetical protein
MEEKEKGSVGLKWRKRGKNVKGNNWREEMEEVGRRVVGKEYCLD